MKKLLKIALVYTAIILFYTDVNGQTLFFPASNEAFQFIGRFDKTNPNSVRFDWPNSTIQFQFTGNEIALALKGGEKNYFNIFIDETLHDVLHQPNDSIIKIQNIQTKGLHTFRLQKRTEGNMGITSFKGIYLPENEKLIVSEIKSVKKIEFIGNSITCGYGNEGLSRNEKFLPSTQNVNKSYALIISKALKAECHVIAHSGLGVVRNYGDKNKITKDRPTMPMRYNHVLDTDTTLKWDFNLWKPDMVFINLGTNDYSTKPHPKKALFQKAYKSLLENVHAVYDNIPIFLISGPLAEEPAYLNIKELTDNLMKSNPNLNLHFIGIPRSLLNDTTDLGSDSHPSYNGHIKMAKHILPIIAKTLGWEYIID